MARWFESRARSANCLGSPIELANLPLPNVASLESSVVRTNDTGSRAVRLREGLGRPSPGRRCVSDVPLRRYFAGPRYREARVERSRAYVPAATNAPPLSRQSLDRGDRLAHYARRQEDQQL